MILQFKLQRRNEKCASHYCNSTGFLNLPIRRPAAQTPNQSKPSFQHATNRFTTVAITTERALVFSAPHTKHENACTTRESAIVAKMDFIVTVSHCCNNPPPQNGSGRQSRHLIISFLSTPLRASAETGFDVTLRFLDQFAPSTSRDPVFE